MALATNGVPSSTHPAFEWLRSEHIDSLNVTVEEYRHKATGAQHYHLAADNDENVFIVALRTVPMDSTGVAHILEHTALCGSEQYPARDPFFMMIRRSLNTFMNAFTSSDWTAYPFASQNRKDFYNLMDVYLDAVFFSRLHELDFAQEGHRLEFADPTDSHSELTYKGVVFNEMKGAMSAPTSVLWQTLSKYLFPTTTYHYNSGGDPEAIPDLSYAELKHFYETHYHPSNAVFMTYGDLPVTEHHARFEERALKRFQRLDVHIAVADEKRYLAPLNVEESYAVAGEEGDADKTHIVIGWLLGRSTDLEAQLQAHLLSGVLLDDSASPLRQALETTKLGSAPSPLCGLEDSNREMSFICGIEGSRPESAQALESLVIDVLQRVADEGIAAERVAAVLHQLELSQREVGGDGFPYGLQLVLQGLSSATHRGDPVAALNLDPVLERLREAIKDPQFVKRLVRECLLENQHRVRLTLKPDPQLAARREQAEKRRLADIAAGLAASERDYLIERARQLAARQEQADDPEVLPKVGLEDVPAQLRIITGRAVDAVPPITVFDQGTNGLVYQQSVTRLPDLEDDDITLLPTFCTLVTEVGLGEQDYLAVQMRQSSVTGGLGAALSIRSAVDDAGYLHGHYVISGKALARNGRHLADLVKDTLHKPRFDEHARLREIVAQERAHKEQSVTGSGHMLAMTAAASGVSSAASLTHRLNGLAGIQRLKKLDQTLDEAASLGDLAARLDGLHARLSAAPVQVLVVGEQQNNAQDVAHLQKLWTAQAAAAQVVSGSIASDFQPHPGELWTTNTQVNFCARAYPTVSFSHPDAPALTVLGAVLRNGFLHRAVREQGGAYGGGASHDADAAAFRFFSYRDPRLQETLDDFQRGIDWVLDAEPEWRLVEEAILGVVGALDKPASPAGEARKTFFNDLYGRSAELRQAFRENVLRVTGADLQRVTNAYLHQERASTAVLTNAATLQEVGDLGLQVHAL
ncbi:MAG: insulinase family protein [Gammaproteobacteria bacterium]|nr:insulinase family protein [Gammaproteobacteria bacterium]